MTVHLPFLAPADLPMAVAAVHETLAAHGVVALPTESFYGLATDPRDPRGVERVLAAKSRAAERGLLVVGGSLAQLEELVVVPVSLRSWLEAVWPAAVTVVLPARRVMPAAGETLAVRVPAHPLLRSLLARTCPLTATSANRSGEPGATSPAGVLAAVGAAVDLLLDGGMTAGGPPSTLLDGSTGTLRVLRAGSWKAECDLAVKIV